MEHKIKDSNSVIEKGSWKNEKQNVVILLKLICSLSDWRCWPSFRVSINFSSCDDENEAWKTKCADRRIMPQEESFVASKSFTYNYIHQHKNYTFIYTHNAHYQTQIYHSLQKILTWLKTPLTKFFCNWILLYFISPKHFNM